MFFLNTVVFSIFQINTAVSTALPAHLAVGPANGLGITSNKTGTLNTKAVTASQLATNSPILPHKIMNGNNMAPAPPSKTDISNGRVGPKGPPALPPRGVSIRSRDSSMNRNDQGMGIKPPPPAVPPKRSSLTRSDLALFSAENVSKDKVFISRRNVFHHHFYLAEMSIHVKNGKGYIFDLYIYIYGIKKGFCIKINLPKGID